MVRVKMLKTKNKKFSYLRRIEVDAGDDRDINPLSTIKRGINNNGVVFDVGTGHEVLCGCFFSV